MIRGQRKERDADAEGNCGSGGWFHLSWTRATNQPRAGRPKALSTRLTDSVAGQFAVKGLIASNLLRWPKDPVLFHAGD
jgi:hypothetical protein